MVNICLTPYTYNRCARAVKKDTQSSVFLGGSPGIKAAVLGEHPHALNPLIIHIMLILVLLNCSFDAIKNIRIS